MIRDYISELGSFIYESPSTFHAISAIKSRLDEAGFEELLEGEKWQVKPGKKYYVIRNQSSVIAFDLGEDLEQYSIHICASHSDAPTFKLKEVAEVGVRGKYTVLNTEGYGGMICSSWFDRPLSIAGRVVVKSGQGIESKLVNLDRDLVMIPNVAIHMNRKINDGYTYNKQVDLLPLFSGGVKETGSLKDMLAAEAGVATEDILGNDLYLYNHTGLSRWGADEEFISAPKLDDLECAFTTLMGFLQGHHRKNMNVFACFDNEEVGSQSKQGAGSTFLYDSLYRMNLALGKDQEAFYQAVAGSMMLSCDNAHAVHPNHPEKTDQGNCVYMNEGVTVKFQAAQKYTTDGVSKALFQSICEKAGVPIQIFANRSDEPGGSTLGNIAMSQVSMNTIDIGLPQLAMHSAYETAGARDVEYMIMAAKGFYSCHTRAVSANGIVVE